MQKIKRHSSDSAEHPLLATNPELKHALAGSMHARWFDAGNHVFSHGDRAVSLWLVYRGWVKLSRQTPDGRETIVGLCADGDIFGEAALFANANYPYTAEIVGGRAELVAISSPILRALVAKEPALNDSVMQLMSERMSQAQLKLEHMSTLSGDSAFSNRTSSAILDFHQAPLLLYALVERYKEIYMTIENHNLVSEFPEYREKIHQLKQSDAHFNRLFGEYDIVTHDVARIETGAEAASDERLESLKKQRLHLKDELFAMLKKAA